MKRWLVVGSFLLALLLSALAVEVDATQGGGISKRRGVPPKRGELHETVFP